MGIKGKLEEAFRDAELEKLNAGQMDDLVIDELANIEGRFGGKYSDACMEALEHYLK